MAPGYIYDGRSGDITHYLLVIDNLFYSVTTAGSEYPESFNLISLEKFGTRLEI